MGCRNTCLWGDVSGRQALSETMNFMGMRLRRTALGDAGSPWGTTDITRARYVRRRSIAGTNLLLFF